MFADRADAGRRLAAALMEHAEISGGLVVALPRGGAVVAHEISQALRLPLEVFIVRKIGYPGNPECACGALAETGLLHRTKESLEMPGLTPAYVEARAAEQYEEIRRLRMLFRGGLPFPGLAGRTVFLVDDGLATGATFEAAVKALRELHPKLLIGAVPVAHPETVQRLKSQLADLVVLEAPESFVAVGDAYEDFRQVDDAEVLQILETAATSLKKANPN